MSAARQRSSKGSSSAGSEKGAQSHSGGADDVAKKQQQQQQAPAKGSKAAAGGRPSPCSLGKAFHALFSLALVGAAVFSGWGVQHLLGEVSQLSLRHEGAARQREELAHALEGVVQKQYPVVWEQQCILAHASDRIQLWAGHFQRSLRGAAPCCPRDFAPQEHIAAYRSPATTASAAAVLETLIPKASPLLQKASLSLAFYAENVLSNACCGHSSS